MGPRLFIGIEVYSFISRMHLCLHAVAHKLCIAVRTHVFRSIRGLRVHFVAERVLKALQRLVCLSTRIVVQFLQFASVIACSYYQLIMSAAAIHFVLWSLFLV